MLLHLGSPKTTYVPNTVPKHYQLQCFSLSSQACLVFEVSGRVILEARRAVLCSGLCLPWGGGKTLSGPGSGEQHRTEIVRLEGGQLLRSWLPPRTGADSLL